MNPLMIVKGLKMFAILGVLTYGLMMVNDFRKDQQAKTDALIEANSAAVSAEAHAQVLATANAQLEAITNAQAAALKQSSIAMAESSERFKEISETQREQTKVLEGNRLETTIRGKRELVERLSNKATRERFDAVEDIFN